MPIGSHAKRNERHKLIRIVEGECVWLETRGANPPDVLVPSEYAPVFAVDLPLAQHRLRVAALPFAIEDRVAQAVDDLVLTLGMEIAPRRYLAAAVASARMKEWQAILAASRIVPRRIIPDAMTVPAPAGESEWSVRVEGKRVLVRKRNGEAFATSCELFDTLWTAAASPRLHRIGQNWSSGLPAPQSAQDVPEIVMAGADTLDLNQNRSGRGQEAYRSVLGAAAAIVGCAALAHTAILALDAGFAASTLEQRKLEAARQLALLAPLVPASGDARADLAQLLPDETGSTVSSQFLPMLARVSSAIQPVSAGVALQSLAYDEASSSLVLKIEAGDLPALERIEQGFSAAGLVVASGGASVGEGRAESSFTVQDAGAATAPSVHP